MTSLPSSTVPQTDPAIDDLIVEFSNIEMEHEYRRLARFYQNFKADLEDDPDDDANDPTRFLSMAMNELTNMRRAPPTLLKALWKDGQRRGKALRPRSRADLCERMTNNNVLGFLLDACIPLEQDSTVDSPDAQAVHLSREFDRIYQGTAVSDFKRGLMDYEQMYDSDRHFGRTIHIVQSSGTGKSRLVKELGHDFPTLSVCFRPPSDIMRGWPPDDIPAREFFLRTGITTMGEELAAAFLGAWLEVALSDITDPGNLDKPVHERLHAWRITAERNGSDSRYDRFIKVVQIAEDRLEREREALASIRRKIMSSTPDSATADEEPTTAHLTAEDSPIEEEISILTWHQCLFRLFVQPSFDQLAKILVANNVKTFLVAFDECMQLDMVKTSPNIRRSTPPQWGMSLMALQHILKATDEFAFPGVRFWFLLLDINSYVTNLAPVGPYVPSFRLRSGFVPLPVWSCLGFDQSKPKRNDLPQTPQAPIFSNISGGTVDRSAPSNRPPSLTPLTRPRPIILHCYCYYVNHRA